MAYKNKLIFESEEDVICLTGSSGSGKSTYMRYLSEKYENIRYFSSDHKVFYGTVKDNILLGRTFDKEKLNEVVKKFELNESFTLGRLISNEKISTGEAQRICLIRNVVLSDNNIILLDEPTSALNELIEDRVIDYLINNLVNFKIKKLIICTHSEKIKKRFKNLHIDDVRINN
ncbi:hypothetical protein MADA3029_270044 [Vibrio nigripulchritudo MADA3029]|uniref:ATP-binding cassette domain-containing protein n=1 Tax=Vibrio nigripulchritudo TaxID=28173 RepID=UPI0003B22333|nr:ATP-binding cassette domain-containing protein [Vibrio nigripulchritudo]CCN47608.1 hypothetical protein VIBNIMADA3020_420044 [Vibrio nigripulchritudo MADA3020]CCN56568.1 hypothetical protein VIBNIMADA3021_970063 [Vibrio nigripulchritudo MADA3021]CCN58807.1 hypothetical protein MADA3029_270044 [Vibrio nigripulchritudo MADA3029]